MNALESFQISICSFFIIQTRFSEIISLITSFWRIDKTMKLQSHCWIIECIDASLASIFWMKKLFQVLLCTSLFLLWGWCSLNFLRYFMTLIAFLSNFSYKPLKSFMLKWNREPASSAMERASVKSYLHRTRSVAALLSNPNFSPISKKSVLSFPSG